MSTLSFLLATHTTLSGDEVAHLQRLASEWQLLSDLSFADFLLWVPVTTTDGADAAAPDPGTPPTFLCVAHSRPTTAPTAHPDDMVGGTATAAQHPQLLRALGDTTMRREEQPRWHRGRSIRREVVPVGYEGRMIAVLGRDTNLAAPRVPSTLDLLPGRGGGPVPDDRGRHLPDRRERGRGPLDAAGGRRPGAGERGRHGPLRQPERGVGVPPPRRPTSSSAPTCRRWPAACPPTRSRARRS